MHRAGLTSLNVEARSSKHTIERLRRVEEDTDRTRFRTDRAAKKGSMSKEVL